MENLAKNSEEKNEKQHIFVIYQNVSTSIKGNSRKIEKQKTYQAIVFFIFVKKTLLGLLRCFFQ